MKPLSPPAEEATPGRAELFDRAEDVPDDEEEERGSPESPGPAAEVRSMAEKKPDLVGTTTTSETRSRKRLTSGKN